MNNKFILVLLICINMVTMILGSYCASNGISCGTSDLTLVQHFFNVDNSYTTGQLGTYSGGFQTNNNLTSASNAILNPQGSGVSVEGQGIFGNLVDALKAMALFFTLFTPLPVAITLTSLGMPLLINLILIPVIVIIYLIGIFEFWRGGSF